jgi:hypothetical protein
MPKKPIDYSNTTFYKLCCKDINVTDIYVEHTTNFTKRKNQHKLNSCNIKSKGYNYYVYQFIRNNGGWGNWDMIEIEKRECSDLNEACRSERQHLERLCASLNKCIPTRTGKEWYEANKEHVKEIQKEWFEQNREEIKEYKRVYHKENGVAIKEKQREWYEQNRENVKEKHKIYQEVNKERTKERMKKWRE